MERDRTGMDGIGFCETPRRWRRREKIRTGLERPCEHRNDEVATLRLPRFRFHEHTLLYTNISPVPMPGRTGAELYII